MGIHSNPALHLVDGWDGLHRSAMLVHHLQQTVSVVTEVRRKAMAMAMAMALVEFWGLLLQLENVGTELY